MSLKTTRRQLVRSLLSITIFSTLVKIIAGCSLPNSQKRSLFSEKKKISGKRPNILFISVDDLRPQLHCYGYNQMITPHIDRLALKGILFKQAYCQIPVCGASRVSLLTGIRPTKEKLRLASTTKDKDLPDTISLPGLLKKHGYSTISNGKVYHVPTDDQQSWSQPPWRPEGGFIGEESYLEIENRSIVKTNDGIGPPFEISNVSDNKYFDGKVADRAVEDLQQLHKENKSFFLAVGFVKPHLPFNAPKKYWDLYKSDEIDIVNNPFRAYNAPEEAFHTWEGLRKFVGVPDKGELSDDFARNLIHGYYACISYIDAQVGKIVDKIDELGLRDNTIIVLWGDHGYHLGENSLWEKHALFDKTLHSPLIISAPGFKEAQNVNALTEFVDVYPTLCELCNIQLPDHLEGESAVPLLKNPTLTWKNAVFSRYKDGEGSIPLWKIYIFKLQWLSLKTVYSQALNE
jgi:iduronate 2-sulfatase